jgi:hypothetical protein
VKRQRVIVNDGVEWEETRRDCRGEAPGRAAKDELNRLLRGGPIAFEFFDDQIAPGKNGSGPKADYKEVQPRFPAPRGGSMVHVIESRAGRALRPADGPDAAVVRNIRMQRVYAEADR